MPPARFLTPGVLALFLGLIACSSSHAGVLPASPSESALDRATNDLVNPVRRGEAERSLLRLTDDRDEVVRVKARAFLARSRRAEGHAKEALPLVNPYADMRPENLVVPRLACYLETALCQASLNEPLSAFKLLDYAKEQTAGLPAVLVRTAFADAVELAPDIAKSLAYLKDAVAYGDRWFRRERISQASGELTPPKPEDGEWRTLRPELLERIGRLERQQRVAKWGLDYVLYLEAQEQRKADHPMALDFTNVRRIYSGKEPAPSSPSGADFSKAFDTYTLIIRSYSNSVFAEASRLYQNVCLAKLGQTDAAIDGLAKMCRLNPNGLYQGEAMKFLGDLWLQDRWDATNAMRCYSQTVDWCHNARTFSETARLMAVPEKCREPASPPADWQQMDNFGVIAYAAIPSGAVVNRLTAPWYLNRLEEDAEFAMGFLHSLTNDWAGALAHYQRAAELDPLLQKAEKNKYYNTLRRLRGSCEKNAYVGEKAENEGLSGVSRMAMLWADFIYMRMCFQQAESLYARLYRGAAEHHADKVAARAGLGLILVAEQENNMPKAQALADEVTKRWPKAPASPYALLLKGLACGNGRDFNYADALTCFREVYTRYPESPLAERARFEEVFRGINARNLEQRRPWIEKFKRDYPKSKYTTTVDAHIRILEKWAAADKARMNKSFAPAGAEDKQKKEEAPRS